MISNFLVSGRSREQPHPCRLETMVIITVWLEPDGFQKPGTFVHGALMRSNSDRRKLISELAGAWLLGLGKCTITMAQAKKAALAVHLH
jgi:hypothetical protein